MFNSDKGRYITDVDVMHGYGEPIVEAPGHFALDAYSLYPPRRDVTMCTTPGCHDQPDVGTYDADVHRIMPEIDTVTMATARVGTPVDIMFTAPDEEWEPGTHRVFVEVSVEGDANAAFPAPPGPSNADWDSWAIGYGYSYRGQPSVVYQMDVALDAHGGVASAMMPAGCGSVDEDGDGGGDMHAMDGTIGMDPDVHPGGGGDRLQIVDGSRVTTTVIPPAMCEMNTAPTAVTNFVVSGVPRSPRCASLRALELRRGGRRSARHALRGPLLDGSDHGRGLVHARAAGPRGEHRPAWRWKCPRPHARATRSRSTSGGLGRSALRTTMSPCGVRPTAATSTARMRGLRVPRR